MKYSEVNRLVAELRELADFIEAQGVRMPVAYHTPTISWYLTENDYVKNPETNEYEAVLNEEKTKRELGRFLAAVGSCEKEYSDNRLQITKKFSCSGRVMITGSVDRALTCRKVYTGKQVLKEATLIPARLEDEYEWECDERVSLLSLVKE